MVEPDYNELMEECCRIALKRDPEEVPPFVGALIWYGGCIIAEGYISQKKKKFKERDKRHDKGHGKSFKRTAQARPQARYLNVRVHAEEMAISNAENNAAYIPSEAILVTTLEPCIPGLRRDGGRKSQTSCCELISERGFRRVVIGQYELTKRMNSYQGFVYLKERGIEVITNEKITGIALQSDANYPYRP